MSYEIGTYINLSSLNRRQDNGTRKTKSFEQKAQNLYIVGTRFIFRTTPAGLQAAIKIPVIFA